MGKVYSGKGQIEDMRSRTDRIFRLLWRVAIGCYNKYELATVLD